MAIRRKRRSGWVLGAAAACGLLAGPAAAQEPADTEGAASKALRIELNKLEPQDNGACRVYFVADNGTATAFSEIVLDIFIFGKDGIISRRVAMTIRPIEPEKTRVVLFDLPDLKCGDIGRFLMNDVLSCRDAKGADADCAGRLVLSSRTEAGFGG